MVLNKKKPEEVARIWVNRHGGIARAKQPRRRAGLDRMIVPDKAALVKLFEELLNLCNVDWSDSNFTESPERVAKAFTETWLSGYALEPKQVFSVFPNESGERDLVIVKDLPVYSMCSHHFAPFFGKAAVAYVPGNLVAGLSKFGRIVDLFSRRFQLQEQLTKQVADSLVQLLQPRGVMVMLYNIEHTCMSSRGIQAHESATTTSAIRGIFESDASLRQEALTLLSIGK